MVLSSLAYCWRTLNGVIFPCLQLENKKDALSPALQHYCHSQPVVIIRGIASVLKLGEYAACGLCFIICAG